MIRIFGRFAGQSVSMVAQRYPRTVKGESYGPYGEVYTGVKVINPEFTSGIDDVLSQQAHFFDVPSGGALRALEIIEQHGDQTLRGIAIRLRGQLN